MVFNPPVLKDGEAKEEPTLIEINPQRTPDSYVEQAKRGVAWVSILVIVWLWQRLLCYLDLPPHCDLPMTALQVLTDLVVLLALGLTQAWFVEILEERRFRHLFKEAWWPIVVIVVGLAVSSFERSDWWQGLRFKKSTEWSESQVVVSALFAVVAALFIGWHFAEAWRILPGAYYVSGNVNINVVIKENLHRIYNVSRGLILVYALLYAAFAFDKREGFEQHYVLLAWVLSLFAQFKNRISILFLALCTGVFVQGIGSYRLRFLCQSMGNHGNGYIGDSEDQ